MLGDLIVWWALSSLILITVAGGTVHGGSSARFPTKPTEKLKIEKMYAIKQIKICAEYRDMLPRPRLDLSGTPGLRPIGLSPGSWQTSLGLGSMSRYSAQILICITVVFYATCINYVRDPLVHLMWNRDSGIPLHLLWTQPEQPPQKMEFVWTPFNHIRYRGFVGLLKHIEPRPRYRDLGFAHVDPKSLSFHVSLPVTYGDLISLSLKFLVTVLV